jgi:DNA-binding MarR family transcriptional regulator
VQAVATLEMDGTNIVGLLNELEARQLIERRRSPEDRRRHLVELTGAGAEQLAKAESALSAAEDEVLGALDETQPETLYSLLQQAAVDTTVSCTAAIDD